jgi:hypothetical protein
MKYRVRSKIKKVIIDDSVKYYDTEYPHDFPIGIYYVGKYKCLPSYCEGGKYVLNVSEYFAKESFELIWAYRKPGKESIESSVEIYEKDGILITVKYKTSKKDSISELNYYSEDEGGSPDYATVTMYYNDDDKLEEIVSSIQEYQVDPKTKSRISLVISGRSGLSTVEQNIKKTDIDIVSNYGEKFVKVHEKIVEKLNEDRGKGLVLLHGVPGTGKTNYIRHLCGLLKKEVIFIPPFMAESISSPDFITFLLDHTNSILVIEDAEKIVLDREGDNSNRQSVSNLLNITDGLLSDCLSIQIIATFNTSRDRIDKALLRKGRLIAEWKFDPLSVDHSNSLLEKIGREDRTKVPMTLTEIYNMDEDVNVVQEERRSIGFGR